MKRVGVITIYDNDNYGNRLQNYALQEAIKMMGMSVQTIINIPYNDYRYIGGSAIIRRLIQKIKALPMFVKKTHCKEVESWFNRLLNIKKESCRYKAFECFDQRISFYPELIGYYNAWKLDKDFDLFVAGSDQVWNCMLGRGTGIDFITFARKGKRVSYAASIALDEIPERFKKRYKAYLNGMNSISVREKRGKEIIENNFGLKAIQVLDPTMLLTKENWLGIADSVKIDLPEKFVVGMFLGENDSFVEAAIRGYADKNDCEIVWLNNSNESQYFSYGPAQFLQVISRAQYVFTDSFHGCVFSILLQKDFYAIHRKGKADNMYSRIEDLLNLFGMRNREFCANSIIEPIKKSQWEYAISILDSQREYSMNFLKTALNKQ